MISAKRIHIALALLLGLSATRVMAQDATLQGDAARTGRIVGLHFDAPPGVMWKFPSTGLGGVLAAGDRVFSSDDRGGLFALNAADGLLHWKTEIAARDCAAPLVSSNIAYYATNNGVFALSAVDGRQVWKYAMQLGAGESSPLRLGHSLLVAGKDGNVHAMDAQLGDPEWTCDFTLDAPPSPPGFDGARVRDVNASARPTMAASDGEVLFQTVFDQCRILAIDGRQGRTLWSFATAGWMYAPPTVDADRVYVGSQDKIFYCLNKKTGSVLWKFATPWRIDGGAALADGKVYFGSCDGSVYCANASTGKISWSFKLDGNAQIGSPINTAPLVGDDALYVVGAEGQVYALALADGHQLWKLRPSADSQLGRVTTNGRQLYVTSRPTLQGQGEHALIAIGLPERP